MAEVDRIKEKLSRLKLKAMEQQLEDIIETTTQKNLGVLSVLDRLADIELEKRWQSSINLRWRQSKLMEKITIDQFDFKHHKSRQDQKNRILNLLTLDFIRKKMDGIFIGNPGTGKTFLPNVLNLKPATIIPKCFLQRRLT